jgi:hypothetical protein
MDQSSIKPMLVTYVESRAETRRQAAAEAGDSHGARSARGLLDVADFVRDLPDDDARLVRIAAVNVDPSGEPRETLLVGAGAEAVADGFRHENLLEDPDALLTRFAAMMEADGSTLYAEGRTLAEIAADLESDQPMAALLAVRHVGEHIDGWEERAVGLAREAGWSWDRVAVVLGRTRQSVWSKHRDAAPRNVLGGAIATTTRAARKVRSVLEAVPQPTFGHGRDAAQPTTEPAASEPVATVGPETAGPELTLDAAPAT